MGPAIFWVVRLVVWLLAAAAALVPMRPEWVERYFSRGAFPAIQDALTTVSNQVPFALFDALLVVIVLWWTVALVVDLVRRRSARRGMPVVLRVAVRTATLIAAGYLIFLAAWGLNYRRVPLRQQVAFDAARISPAAARELVARSITRMNALYDAAHAEARTPTPGVDPVLARALADVERHLGAGRPTVPARPKRTLLDFYFRRAAVAGMTDPYFLETLVTTDLLPVERPFVIAHEWSHLAGFADESDANFVGWLTCLRGSPLHQYSGWLFLYGEAASALDPEALRSTTQTLAGGPRADLRAIRDRLRRHVNPRVSAAGWMAYDHYLKANRVEEGTSSYGEVVALVLGTEFDKDGRPRLRN